ncbi:Ankyrin repeat-containing protein [Actinidia chinensis var. chinensis]|uniref:Ankyrin repeat-containing protein n=1 Tax=Actinidia chinensis var. chinensis TaxID=1590841 RepID=A0A2R6Q568_ACTCC|nr:Ankyrin repeat-containing protein [Actinidia chinensis var. chinensis]
MFDEYYSSMHDEVNKLQQKDEYWRYIPLVKAALSGNWESAERFFDQDNGALTVPITKSSETALHIAVGTGKAQNFVKKLVESVPLEALELCDDKGYTALHTAAWVGNTAAAMVLVKKHTALLHIRCSIDDLPIHVAAKHCRKETLYYLLSVTKDDPASKPYHGESGIWLLLFILSSEFYDVALDLIHRYPELAISKRDNGNVALTTLVGTASAFPSGSHLNCWQRIIYSCVPGKVESCSKDHSRGDTEDQINTSPDNTECVPGKLEICPKDHSRGDTEDQINTSPDNTECVPGKLEICPKDHSRGDTEDQINTSPDNTECVPGKVESYSKDHSRGDIEDQINTSPDNTECVPESCSKDHNRGDIEDQSNTSPLLIDQKYNWPQFFGANFCISAHKVSQKLHFILWKVFEFAVPQIKGIREEKQKHNQAFQIAKCVCKAIQSLNDSDAYESHAIDPLFNAANLGVHEVVEEIVDSFPSLVWARDLRNWSIFHHAIIQRHVNVFNLLYQMSERIRLITIFRDSDDNTTLHFAGMLAPPNKLNLVPGAALQMQRELQWFEEAKKFVTPLDMHLRNKYNQTGQMVFTEAHKELVVEGEKWMKHTANSCTIVSALIVTIAFAAAISVPGGNNDANGLPILSNETAFLVFAISNAFSLFTSTTSLVMFLSILTSTYAEKDFLFALPKRLIIGLVTLFFSITAMMVAFSAIVYLLFGYNKRWVLIPTGVFSGIPIISFVFLEFPLLLDLITSTYGGGIFGKKSNRLLY